MGVGDLVKVKNLTSSAFGIIIEEPLRHWFVVYFFSLEYDMVFGKDELEAVNGEG
jgi:hypothetical protein|tara:strand:- start:131 stop:295 length:165 start_codon:yes stop_codon:yes gene_type:complete